jgi:hypothetical protein
VGGEGRAGGQRGGTDRLPGAGRSRRGERTPATRVGGPSGVSGLSAALILAPGGDVLLAASAGSSGFCPVLRGKGTRCQPWGAADPSIVPSPSQNTHTHTHTHTLTTPAQTQGRSSSLPAPHSDPQGTSPKCEGSEVLGHQGGWKLMAARLHLKSLGSGRA